MIFAAFGSGSRSHFDYPVCLGEDLRVVIDEDDGVSVIDEILHDADKADDVCRMEPDGRLVQDIKNARRPVSDGAGKLHSLSLPGRESRGGTIQQRDIQGPDPAVFLLWRRDSQMLSAMGRISSGRLPARLSSIRRVRKGASYTPCPKRFPEAEGRRALSERRVPMQSGQISCLRNFSTRFMPLSSLTFVKAFSTVRTAL